MHAIVIGAIASERLSGLAAICALITVRRGPHVSETAKSKDYIGYEGSHMLF